MIVHSRACYRRVILGACCVLSGWAATAQALVTIDFLEKNSNAAVVYVPLSGATYDITVRLTSDEQVRGVSSAGMLLVASAPGYITVTGSVGGQGAIGTGTRYNNPTWDASSDNSAYPVSYVAGPLTTTPTASYYASSIQQADPFFATSVLGWINVVLGPGAQGDTVLMSPASIVISDYVSAGQPIIDTTSHPVVFEYVPEPSLCLLMSGCVAIVLGSFRNRGVGRRLRRSALGASGWSESQ